MRFILLPLLLHLVSAPHATGADDPKLTVPPEVKAVTGDLVTIKAETAGKKVIWKVPASLKSRECCDKSINVVAGLPGRYSITAISAIGDEPLTADTVLIVEGMPPGPGPGPGPGPNPPLPPPADPLEADLKTLYAAEPSPDKSATVAKLAALYKVAANSCQDPNTDTAGRLAQVIRDASTNLVGSGLMSLRRRVGEELAKVLPTDPDARLTADIRDRAAKLFLRLNQICEAIK